MTLMRPLLFFLLTPPLFLSPSFALEPESLEKRQTIIKELTREMIEGKTIELEALEIRARIHEPNVIYVLDRARVEVHFAEEEVTFSQRVFQPLLENEF